MEGIRYYVVEKWVMISFSTRKKKTFWNTRQKVQIIYAKWCWYCWFIRGFVLFGSNQTAVFFLRLLCILLQCHWIAIIRERFCVFRHSNHYFVTTTEIYPKLVETENTFFQSLCRLFVKPIAKKNCINPVIILSIYNIVATIQFDCDCLIVFAFKGLKLACMGFMGLHSRNFFAL